jgi:nucleoside recognition membrane protein YjiH
MFLSRLQKSHILTKIVTISIVSIGFIMLIIFLYFMPLIEEDDNQEEVHQRFAEIFTEQIGITKCFLYQIISAKKAMQLTFPIFFDQAETLCNHAILDDNDLCKARKTGHTIVAGFGAD